jgi:hypothetical protein
MEINPELRGFVDENGKFKSWPAKMSKQVIMIDLLGGLFETGRTYTAQEINELLGSAHTFNDSPMLRRELINRKILLRTPDGREYWKNAELKGTGA